MTSLRAVDTIRASKKLRGPHVHAPGPADPRTAWRPPAEYRRYSRVHTSEDVGQITEVTTWAKSGGSARFFLAHVLTCVDSTVACEHTAARDRERVHDGLEEVGACG